MALIDGIKHKYKATRDYSSKQEKEVAKSLLGTVTPNSGATKFSKGDVHTDLFQIECKTQEKHKESFSIKREWLEKNLQETLITGKKYTALAFNFGPGEENYFIIDENLFLILKEYLEGK